MIDEKYTLGVEEEYLIIRPGTRAAAANPSPHFFKACKKALGERVTPEFLRCQIEIATGVCDTVADVRSQVADMRGTLARIATEHDLALMAASTHPFTPWTRQKPTKGERYVQLDSDLQGAIRRMMICGMHVHIGLLDENLRIDVMNQMRYFLPHMLALSTSSPFWEGNRMGMKSYRLSVFDGMPRTGIPEELNSYADYERLIGVVIDAGVIEDASKIWWDIRPSVNFPTVEMRICDICTRIDDAMTITAIYQSLARRIIRFKKQNMKWRVYPAFLIEENRWLAQRFGVKGQLVDLGRGESRDYSVLLEELIAMISEDADALGCLKEVEHAREILKRGSSACRQVETFEAHIEAGVKKTDALKGVVDQLVEETVMGL